MVGFWSRLLTGKDLKISFILYKYMLATPNIEFKWLKFVKTILWDIGRNDIWLNQSSCSLSTKNLVKLILCDQFIQNWHSQLQQSSKGNNYSVFKETCQFENYLKLLPRALYLNIFRLRTTNHRLPIEIGRWQSIALNERKCKLCDLNELGDEFHYLLVCPFFSVKRRQLIDSYYIRRPNISKYIAVLNNQTTGVLTNLSRFIGIILKQFK